MTSIAARSQQSAANPVDLDEQIAALVAAHPGKSGVRLLADGLNAFAVRVHGARLARRSLDVQTYIWHDDATGRYIARELILAAERGVRVRVLLDDMDARPRDVTLEALDKHAHVEVRMFNPFRTRSGWLRTLAELLHRGSRLNHRMHNKSWIVDEQFAIVGGRNIGDEYFSSAGAINFLDLDVLMLGPAVRDTTSEFERYWTSALSVPVKRLRKYARKKLHPRRLREDLDTSAQRSESSAFVVRLREQEPLTALLGKPMVWSRDVRVVADDPLKAAGLDAEQASHVLDCMVAEIRATTRQLLMISPYFIPGVGGTAALRSLALQGAEVLIQTNSLAATDVAAVHSGYVKYRRPLLEAGIRIYEMKHAPTIEELHTRFRLGSSRGSLHTKAAVLDGERVFVGSFNIDPRSATLNCEMGVWIRHTQLACELRDIFNYGTDPRRSHALMLDVSGALAWVEIAHGEVVRHKNEPHASWIRRTVVRILEMFPIEAQL